jgi:hypothetical protein
MTPLIDSENQAAKRWIWQRSPAVLGWTVVGTAAVIYGALVAAWWARNPGSHGSWALPTPWLLIPIGVGVLALISIALPILPKRTLIPPVPYASSPTGVAEVQSTTHPDGNHRTEPIWEMLARRREQRRRQSDLTSSDD